MTHTTVRTSSTKALADWKAAQRAVELAARKYADTHTIVTRNELEKARATEAKLLKNYSDSRLIKFTAVLDGRR